MLTKTHSWPADHWHWPIALSHFHGVKRGGLIFTGGQADLDKQGLVVNPDDLAQQTRNVMSHVEAILKDFEASLSDIVKLVIYFTGDESDELQILDLISIQLDNNTHPVVSTICLPALCYPGMRIELEAVAIDPAKRSANNPEYRRGKNLPALHPHYSHAILCNDLIFTSDISAISADGGLAENSDVVEQTQIMMDQVENTLAMFDKKTADVLKLNVFYLGDGSAENWARPAEIRAAYFEDPGPAATGISVSRFAKPGLKTKIAVTAAAKDSNPIGANATVQYSWPENHWNWTKPLPYKHGNRFGNIIHLGGQVALDSNANVLHPDDIVEQTKIALANIHTVLKDLGAKMDDVVKVTTFYQGETSEEALHKNLVIRSNAFSKPGPATSGIPAPHLVYQSMVIEIEIIAIVDA